MDQKRRTFLQQSATAIAAATVPQIVFALDSKGTIKMATNNSWTVGDIKCTALLDGVFQADPSIISATDEAAFAELVSRETGQSDGKFNLDVNAFLLEVSG